MKISKLKRRKQFLARLLSIVVLVLLAMGLGSYLYYQDQLEPVAAKDEYKVFMIENGSTVNTVIQNLEKNGIIKSAFVMKLYTKFHQLNVMKAGEYSVNLHWTVPELIAFLSGDNAIANHVSITIPEGTWAKDIAANIASKTNITKEELLGLWSDRPFLEEMISRYDFLSEDIFKKELFIPLEGFLYPETYYFYQETTPRDVTIKMLDQTALVLKEYENEIKESKLSMFELVSLASLVQFEANNPVDMKLVAGIFYKRMSIDMPLQASASVCYALYEKYKTWRDCEYNIDIKSPYNTYYVNALPIGPISNPGKDAFEAVFKPTMKNYLYFISDVKGDRKNYYAESYAEHLKNVAKYLE